MYSYGSPHTGRAKAGRPARTYIQQLCEDTGCCPEDLPRAMNDRGGVAREGQGYPCCQHDMMMMILTKKKKMANEKLTLRMSKYHTKLTPMLVGHLS